MFHDVDYAIHSFIPLISNLINTFLVRIGFDVQSTLHHFMTTVNFDH